MNYQTPSDPFPISSYYGPDYFCNREEESAHIKKILQNGQSCILIRNSRLGKPALNFHIKHLLPAEYGLIYLAIQATENEQQLNDAFASALLQTFPEKSSTGRRAWKFIKGI
jgi:hypothetical protein